MPVEPKLHTDGDPLDFAGERPFTSDEETEGSDGVAGTFSPGAVLADPYVQATQPVAIGEDSGIAVPAFTAAAGNKSNIVLSVTSPALGQVIEASVFKDKDLAGSGQAGEFVKKKDWTRVTPVAEVQTIGLGDIGAADTFTLTFGGQTTSALAFQVSAAAMQTALEALSTISVGDIAVVKNSDAEYVVTFDTELGDVGAITITPTGFTPTGVVETTKGVPALSFGPADGIAVSTKYVVAVRQIVSDRVGPSAKASVTSGPVGG